MAIDVDTQTLYLFGGWDGEVSARAVVCVLKLRSALCAACVCVCGFCRELLLAGDWKPKMDAHTTRTHIYVYKYIFA